MIVGGDRFTAAGIPFLVVVVEQRDEFGGRLAVAGRCWVAVPIVATVGGDVAVYRTNMLQPVVSPAMMVAAAKPRSLVPDCRRWM